MTEVVLWGSTGQMGRSLERLISGTYHDSHRVAGRIHSSSTAEEIEQAFTVGDLILDFSSVSGTQRLWESLAQSPVPRSDLPAVLLSTTGLSDELIATAEEVTRQLELRVLWAPNTSLGIAVLYQTVKQWMGVLGDGDQGFDIELVEYHHNKKADNPSGTAKLLLGPVLSHPDHAQPLMNGHPPTGRREKGQVGVHGIRGGGIYGSHELHFISPDEHLTISHKALSREVFARGALLLSQPLLSESPGFYRYERLDWSYFHKEKEAHEVTT